MIPDISITGNELKVLLSEEFWQLMAFVMAITGPLWLFALARLLDALARFRQR